MNFLDLQYFIEVVKEKNITKAADNLFVTQQALSKRITKLESELGTELITRTTPISLTETGVLLANHAQTILSQKKRLEQELQDIKDYNNSTLSIGVSNDKGTILLPAIIPEFRKQHPKIKLKISENSAHLIKDALLNQTIDLAIGFPFSNPAIVSVPIYTETFVVVIPNEIFNTYFTKEEQQNMLQADALPLRTFRFCPFIAYNQATWLKQTFEACCSNEGIEPKIIMETSNLMTKYAMCLSGLGIMFASQYHFNNHASILHLEQPSKIKVFQISGIPSEKSISISYLKTHYRSMASKLFIKTAKEIFKEK